MMSSARRTRGRPTPGGSSRARPTSPGSVAPPPEPILADPWSVVAVAAHGPELALVHRWMNAAHVASRWEQDWPIQEWSDEVAAQLAGEHSRPWIVVRDGEPVAYIEVYRVAADLLAEHLDADAADLGIHIVVGDPERTGQGLGTTVLRTVADGLLAADPACTRVLGDPEAGPRAARAAFAAGGFVLTEEIDRPHKRAGIMVRTRPEAAA